MEIRRELRSLVADKLVRGDGQGAATRYLLSDDGLDFVTAGYPWERIDPYSGEVGP